MMHEITVYFGLVATGITAIAAVIHTIKQSVDDAGGLLDIFKKSKVVNPCKIRAKLGFYIFMPTLPTEAVAPAPETE